ncbi:MAG: DUF4199 domain-containing protein [Ferruginibacter sp.]
MSFLTPTVKGLITGFLMIAVSVVVYSSESNTETYLPLLTYVLYIGGIIWTLISYSRQEVLKSFKTYFTQGFRCFIIVTFLMVIYNIILIKMSPGIIEENAQQTRDELIRIGNKTQSEIDTIVLQSKEYYTTIMTSLTIFWNLLIGSITTIIVSLFLLKTQRHHNKNTI